MQSNIRSDLAISIFDLGALGSKKHRDFVEYERSRAKLLLRDPESIA
jgi:hypothetical protein